MDNHAVISDILLQCSNLGSMIRKSLIFILKVKINIKMQGSKKLITKIKDTRVYVSFKSDYDCLKESKGEICNWHIKITK